MTGLNLVMGIYGTGLSPGRPDGTVMLSYETLRAIFSYAYQRHIDLYMKPFPIAMREVMNLKLLSKGFHF